jgi:hypothetical protein
VARGDRDGVDMTAEPSSGPVERVKLSLDTKLIYGAPSIAGAAMAIPVAIHVNPFYSDTILVPLAWVALASACRAS